MENKGYYLIDLERSVQSKMVFYWRPNRQGYTTDLENAGVYKERDSEELVDTDINKTTIRVSKETINSILKIK